MQHGQYIDKSYLYAKDPYEAKCKVLINKREGAGLRHYKDFKAFIEYSNNGDDIYGNLFSCVLLGAKIFFRGYFVGSKVFSCGYFVGPKFSLIGNFVISSVGCMRKSGIEIYFKLRILFQIGFNNCEPCLC